MRKRRRGSPRIRESDSRCHVTRDATCRDPYTLTVPAGVAGSEPPAGAGGAPAASRGFLCWRSPVRPQNIATPDRAAWPTSLLLRGLTGGGGLRRAPDR
jgi:hypothetical protein